ncbi:MAG: DUF1499 domain-containing protein [Rhodobacteraceae bacterium]|nr:DUF1499 domain-containing protein [Paracoccaceae bacterium]MCA0184645.1 DUF1499 domain-containing protein [Pseudomonadota bacterium]
MRLLLAALALLIAGGAGYIRLAPSDPARWHVAPRLAALEKGGPSGQVLTVEGGAAVQLASADPAALLARLDRIALATPRTQRLAGSVAEGRITWISRSLFWGFPDYTTAQVTPEGLVIHARQRFGSNDWGVNAARLEIWLTRLSRS